MSLPPPSPHKVEIEHLVRRSIYQRLGKEMPHAVRAPNPLLVNISARHCHLTPQAVEALFGKGAKLTPLKWLYQKDQFAAKETVTLAASAAAVRIERRNINRLSKRFAAHDRTSRSRAVSSAVSIDLPQEACMTRS